MFFKDCLRTEKNTIILADVLIVITAYCLAVGLNVSFSNLIDLDLVIYKFSWVNVLWVISCPVVFYVFELYEEKSWRLNSKLLVCISVAVIVTSLVIALIFYASPPNIITSGIVIIIYVILAIPFLFFWRKIYLKNILKNRTRQQKILCVGNSSIVEDIKTIVSQESIYSLKVIGDYTEIPGIVRIDGSHSSKNFFDFVIDSQTNIVVIAAQLDNHPILRKQLIDLRFLGVVIFDAPFFYQALTGKVPINQITDSWFMFQNQGDMFSHPTYGKVKKVLDMFLALVGVILSCPLMLLAALSIKLTSKGPILFKQKRLGQNEQPYTLIKFRTMIDNAEKLTGPKWATENDPRITKLGGIIRKTRIDELPQFFNILKGEMSFVGPRPIRKVMADMLAEDFPYYRLRFTVKPGLTGWAQVKGDYAGTKEGQFEKLQYDLFYIQNQSILFDLLILLKTVQTIIFRRGI